jgi:L-lactate dehydrogenase complex protein LldF
VSATFSEFRKRTEAATKDAGLQRALDIGTGNFRRLRSEAFTRFRDAEALRDQLQAIRSSTLAHLADHLAAFERAALAAGAQVHWARTAAEACDIVVGVAREHEVTLATKTKSMTTEEIHLNDALAAAGVESVETDLGEWIIQLAGETPSHIIAPAIHKTRQQIAALLSREAGRALSPDDLSVLTDEARRMLRERFLLSGMGITGGNMVVAETGSLVLVTNEGNGRLVTSVPPVHVAIVGIEKVVPTWAEAAVWLALLARSAAGQPLSVYTSILTGPSRADDADGPGEMHIVLLDNGRSGLVGTKYEEILRCIRCGACLNVCPVYCEAGGHAYASPYCGPIGAVISPLLFGLKNYDALPHASSLCGACREVCPARIDLPRMLLELRSDEVSEGVLSWWERKAEEAAAAALGSEKRMRFVAGMIRLLQRPFLRGGTVELPRALSSRRGLRLPALAKRSFRELWRSGELEDAR